jgi:hypothetical protein
VTLTFSWGVFLLVFMIGMFIGCIWRCPACNRLKRLSDFDHAVESKTYTPEPVTVCKMCLVADQLSERNEYMTFRRLREIEQG